MHRVEDLLYRAIGSVLGLAAMGCGGAPAYGAPSPEYAAPYATYHLGGTITDAVTGAPVPGIRFAFGNTANTLSGADGSFTLDATTTYCAPCPAKAADVDGALNGSYQDQDVPLILTQTGLGDGKWNRGTFEQKNLAIKLDPKP